MAKGWHGDSAGHARAARKRGRAKKAAVPESYKKWLTAKRLKSKSRKRRWNDKAELPWSHKDTGRRRRKTDMKQGFLANLPWS